MIYRLGVEVLITICFGSVLYGNTLHAQEAGDYFTLMQEADQLFAESKISEARLQYAKALSKGSTDAEKGQVALFLAMTFEKDGVFQEAECRDWATKQFSGKHERDWVEYGIQEYRHKFLGDVSSETTWDIYDTELPSKPSVSTAPLILSRPEELLESLIISDWRKNLDKKVRNLAEEALARSQGEGSPSGPAALLSWQKNLEANIRNLVKEELAKAKSMENNPELSMLIDRKGNLEENIRSLVYGELIRSGEELNLQGNSTKAREAFAKALVLEPRKDSLSRSAMGIVLSFQGEGGLDVSACKKWSQVNIPVAENRLRIVLAIGELYYRNQDYNKAITCLKDVVNKKGSVADMGALVVALSLLEQGKHDAALAELNRVASESSSKEIAAKSIFLVGWAHLQVQQHVAAREAFDKLVREYPESQFAEKAIELSERLKSHTE